MPDHDSMLFKLCAIDDHQSCGGGDALTWCSCDCHRDRADYEDGIPPLSDEEVDAMGAAIEKEQGDAHPR